MSITSRTRALPHRIIQALAVGGVLATFALAGPLDPPAGPITSTFKTLNDVEPRMAINAVNTPGDATSLYKITLPGSYFLTGDTGPIGAGKHGILIAASNVTVDLRGFAIWSNGSTSPALDGIHAGTGVSHVAVRNGFIHTMNGSGIDMSLATGCRIENVEVYSNRLSGVSAGFNATIAGCVAYQNGAGIVLGQNGTITGSTAQENTQDGIVIASGTVTNCAALSNSGDGIDAQGDCVLVGCTSNENVASGIQAAAGTTITGCTAGSNNVGINAGGGCTVTGCTADGNTTNGITVTLGSTVSQCTSRANGMDGIRVLDHCAVLGCTCQSNGPGGTTTGGIHATQAGNRIEGNTCIGGGCGIKVDFPENVIVRNVCSGNTLNWSLVANNVYGPILDRHSPASAAVSGNSATSSLGSTDPNANFTY